MDKTSLGNRMKWYERESTGTFLPMIPVVARLDGKCFSKLTKDFARPYDSRMSYAMIETTKALVKESNALIGYTQSDEITLIFYSNNPKGGIFFDGKKQKMTSVLASIATAHFDRHFKEIDPNFSSIALFDCRAYQVPNQIEACNSILWRELDAQKNSVQMLSRCHFSHKELMHKNQNDQIDMLFNAGINYYNLPSFFRRGTYVKRVPVLKGGTRRTAIKSFNPPPFKDIVNKIDFVFDNDCMSCYTRSSSNEKQNVFLIR